MKSYYHYVHIGDIDEMDYFPDSEEIMGNVVDITVRRTPPQKLKITFNNTLSEKFTDINMVRSDNWIDNRTILENLPISLLHDFSIIPPTVRETSRIIDIIIDESENI